MWYRNFCFLFLFLVIFHQKIAPLKANLDCTIGEVKNICDTELWSCNIESFCRSCTCQIGRWRTKHCGQEECPIADFVEVGTFDNSTYTLGQKKKSWLPAKSSCISAGGHLVTIESDEELKALYDLLLALPKYLKDNWSIGGYSRGQGGYQLSYSGRGDIAESGDWSPWFWVSGAEIPLDHPRFGPGMAFYNDAPKCLVLWPYSTSINVRWRPTRCRNRLFYLCEKTV